MKIIDLIIKEVINNHFFFKYGLLNVLFVKICCYFACLFFSAELFLSIKNQKAKYSQTVTQEQ